MAESGEAYNNRSVCIAAAQKYGPLYWPVMAEVAHRGRPLADVSDDPPPTEMVGTAQRSPPGTTHVWKAADGYRWRAVVASNSRVVAESGEAYQKSNAAMDAALGYGPTTFAVSDHTSDPTWTPPNYRPRTNAR